MRKLSDFDFMLTTVDVEANKVKEELRQQFVNQFPPSFIKEMSYTDYVLGQTNRDNFCYQIEIGLRSLGGIQGATSHKFGMYQAKDSGEIVLAEKWNVSNSPELTFLEIRKSILELLTDGKKNNRQGIIDNKISPMFRYKILSVYYPNQFLSIFSENHLNFFIAQFYEDVYAGDKFTEIYDKQMELIRIQNEHEVAKNWNGIEYMNYLYHIFPQAHNVRKKEDIKVIDFREKNDVPPSVKNDLILTEINAEIKTVAQLGNSKKRNIQMEDSEENVPSIKGKEKIDFQARQKRLAEIGETGERIVVEYERERLSKFHELSRRVKQVSLSDDSLGYDIRSFDENGIERQIEVKSTTSMKSNKLEFYVSNNELQKAKQLPNYWIYYVFDVEGIPEIVKVKNPFVADEIRKIEITPTNYFVQFKTE